MSAQLFQVTIGSATTQFIATDTPAKQIIIQNNASHACRVGDSSTSSTKGIYLAPGPGGGSVSLGSLNSYSLNLDAIWVNGTQNDVIDALVIS